MSPTRNSTHQERNTNQEDKPVTENNDTVIYVDNNHTIERSNFLNTAENGKLLRHQENQVDVERMNIIDDEVRKAEDDMINNYRSPATRKQLNKYISKITITNSLHRTSNDTTDGTTTNYEYTNEFSTGDIKNTKQQNINISQQYHKIFKCYNCRKSYKTTIIFISYTQ